MDKMERAAIAKELLAVRKEIDALYQSAYHAFAEATTLYGEMIKPIVQQQTDLIRKLVALESAIYKDFKNEA